MKTSIVDIAVRFVRSLVVGVWVIVSSVVQRGLTFVEDWLVDAKHARYGLAVTRILLGLTAIGLLVTNFSTRLYSFGSGSAWNGEAADPLSDFPKIWLFSAFHRLALNDAGFTTLYLVLLGLAVLLLVGWRTKIVLPIFFVGWVSFIEMTDSLGDQGDNMYRITMLSLMFADTSSRWSLDARRRAAVSSGSGATGGWLSRKWQGEAILPGWLTNLSHNLVLVAVTCHACFVYASGALYKAGGSPWQAGYAIYNPLHTARFGPWPELSDLLGTWAPMVTAVSWASIILQMCFPMALLNRTSRIIALFGICGFHIGIAVLMGLPWFSLAMIAIDAIFIRDVTWQHASRFVRRSWKAARAAPVPDAESASVAVVPSDESDTAEPVLADSGPDVAAADQSRADQDAKAVSGA